MATTAQIIAERLYVAGCRHAFGIPGGEVLAMMAALDAAGIQFTLTKHENGAGYMAEGTHHATGAPGILLATIGPGITNGVNTIANALQDRVPLIVLTGCIDAADQMTFTHQVLDHNALMAPVTKASLTAVDGAVDVVIDKALAIATQGRPGPVHIDIPISLATMDQPQPRGILQPPPAPAAPAEGPALDRARALFDTARKPIMVAGLDVLYEDGGSQAVRDFVKGNGIPLITTYKAKGILPEDHPLSLGGHGLSPLSDTHILPLLEKADLVIAAGYDPIEMRMGWRDPWDAARAIEFFAVANDHYVHHADLSFVCGVAGGLKALGTAGKDLWPAGEPAAARAALRECFAAGGEWGPGQAIAALRRALPPDCVVTADTGAHRIVLNQMWDCASPRTLLQSSALGTMGCALPMAIGHKLAAKDRPVVAVMGDAGLEMIMGELATLRDLKLTLPIVVFVDESLALIELKQRANQWKNLGVDFGGTDFAALAKAMGGTGRIADSPQAVGREAKAALSRDGFTVIAIPIERGSYDGRI